MMRLHAKFAARFAAIGADASDVVIGMVERIRAASPRDRVAMVDHAADIARRAGYDIAQDLREWCGASSEDWQKTLVEIETGRRTNADREFLPFRDRPIVVRWNGVPTAPHGTPAPTARVGRADDRIEVMRQEWIAYERRAARLDAQAARAQTRAKRRADSAHGRMVRGVWVMK